MTMSPPKGPWRFLTLEELRELAREEGFADPDTAAAIAMAESSGDPWARGDPHTPSECSTAGPSTSFGLWQINLPAHPEYRPNAIRLLEPRYNAQAALAISRGGTSWQPWSTYHPGAHGEPAAYLAWMPGGAHGGSRV